MVDQVNGFYVDNNVPYDNRTLPANAESRIFMLPWQSHKHHQTFSSKYRLSQSWTFLNYVWYYEVSFNPDIKYYLV